MRGGETCVVVVVAVVVTVVVVSVVVVCGSVIACDLRKAVRERLGQIRLRSVHAVSDQQEAALDFADDARVIHA